eukprot:SAG31_NODE_2688_length_5250_cov_11.245583_4_plen_178_part_00
MLPRLLGNCCIYLWRCTANSFPSAPRYLVNRNRPRARLHPLGGVWRTSRTCTAAAVVAATAAAVVAATAAVVAATAAVVAATAAAVVAATAAAVVAATAGHSTVLGAASTPAGAHYSSSSKCGGESRSQHWASVLYGPHHSDDELGTADCGKSNSCNYAWSRACDASSSWNDIIFAT